MLGNVVGAFIVTSATAGATAGASTGATATAGATSRAGAVMRPAVVEVAEGTLEGPGGHGVAGPAELDAVFPEPTKAGDLLVAAVIDGVVTSGMRQPGWDPTGWRLAVDEIGGETATDGVGPPRTGGLQASVWFWPDNPGGVTAVRFGEIPAGTTAAVTAYVAELSGVPRKLRVVATGTSTSGPTSGTYTDRSTVETSRAPSVVPALVLAAFTNGGTDPYGERFQRSSGWTTIGQDPDRGGVDQPILFDERVWRSHRRVSEAMRYDETIDNCAAMAALA